MRALAERSNCLIFDGLLNGVEVGGIGRRITAAAPGGVNKLPHSSYLWAARLSMMTTCAGLGLRAPTSPR